MVIIYTVGKKGKEGPAIAAAFPWPKVCVPNGVSMAPPIPRARPKPLGPASTVAVPVPTAGPPSAPPACPLPIPAADGALVNGLLVNGLLVNGALVNGPPRTLANPAPGAPMAPLARRPPNGLHGVLFSAPNPAIAGGRANPNSVGRSGTSGVDSPADADGCCLTSSSGLAFLSMRPTRSPADGRPL